MDFYFLLNWQMNFQQASEKLFGQRLHNQIAVSLFFSEEKKMCVYVLILQKNRKETIKNKRAGKSCLLKRLLMGRRSGAATVAGLHQSVAQNFVWITKKRVSLIWVLIVCTRNVHLQFKRCNINSKDGVVGCLDRAVNCKVRKVKGRSGRSKGRKTRKCL